MDSARHELRSPKPGIESTDKSTSLHGVDIFKGKGGFTRVQRYFDQKTLFEQIGMQVIVEPITQGRAFYGHSKRVASGNPAVPAVIGMTWIRFCDQSELDHIRVYSAKIIQEFLEEPGFISIVTGAAGDRAFTVTAWENEDACTMRLISPIHAPSMTSGPEIFPRVYGPASGNRIT